MKHLSGLDSVFLHLESPEMPMHVGSLNVIELPEGHSGNFFEEAKTYIAQRMHLADVFTRKLVFMPLDISNPVWVEDDAIDLDYHIRHVTLPQPGTNRQLQQYVARLHSSLLDRSRPLWEFFVIDGLKSGEVAIYSKLHHAGVDGQAGVAVAKAIFNLSPNGRQIKPPRPRVRRNQYQLGGAELLGAALQNTMHQSMGLLRSIPLMARAAKSVLIPDPDEQGKRHWGLPKNIKLLAPRTLFNSAITNQRTFAGRTMPLSEVKHIATAFGVSVNDVVMATSAGAVRAYLKECNDLPAESLCAAVPVSLRQEGDGSSNNQVTMLRTDLATNISDPLERLRKIQASSQSAKNLMGRLKSAVPTDFPLPAAPWLMSACASLFSRSRLANALPPLANLVISNVTGIPVQVYFAGAKVVSYYPVSIAVHGMALNITVQSYNGRMDYGLLACQRAVPDINDLADLLLLEHKKLLALASPSLATPDLAQAPSQVATAPNRTATRKPRKKAPPKSLALQPQRGALVNAEPVLAAAAHPAAQSGRSAGSSNQRSPTP